MVVEHLKAYVAGEAGDHWTVERGYSRLSSEHNRVDLYLGGLTPCSGRHAEVDRSGISPRCIKLMRIWLSRLLIVATVVVFATINFIPITYQYIELLASSNYPVWFIGRGWPFAFTTLVGPSNSDYGICGLILNLLLAVFGIILALRLGNLIAGNAAGKTLARLTPLTLEEQAILESVNLPYKPDESSRTFINVCFRGLAVALILQVVGMILLGLVIGAFAMIFFLPGILITLVLAVIFLIGSVAEFGLIRSKSRS